MAKTPKSVVPRLREEEETTVRQHQSPKENRALVVRRHYHRLRWELFTDFPDKYAFAYATIIEFLHKLWGWVSFW